MWGFVANKDPISICLIQELLPPSLFCDACTDVLLPCIVHFLTHVILEPSWTLGCIMTGYPIRVRCYCGRV